MLFQPDPTVCLFQLVPKNTYIFTLSHSRCSYLGLYLLSSLTQIQLKSINENARDDKTKGYFLQPVQYARHTTSFTFAKIRLLYIAKTRT